MIGNGPPERFNDYYLKPQNAKVFHSTITCLEIYPKEINPEGVEVLAISNPEKLRATKCPAES